jgi:hypothetical protein
MFSKNNWEKTIAGLFTDESLKKSVHQGKEKRINDDFNQL